MDLGRSDRLGGRRGCLERADGFGGYNVSVGIEDLDGKRRMEVFGKAESAFAMF